MSNTNDNSSNEWKTVTRGRYVPPSKRSEVEKLVAEEEKKKPLDLTSDKSFPTLGVTTKATVWGDKKSFTETIHGLIALEQRTAEEREAAEEEARKNEGIAVLKLPRTPEDFIGFNERMYERSLKVDKELEMIELGMQKMIEHHARILNRPIYCSEEFMEQMEAEEDDTYTTIYRQSATPYFVATPTAQTKSKDSSSAAKRKSLLERKRQSLLAQRAAAMATVS